MDILWNHTFDLKKIQTHKIILIYTKLEIPIIMEVLLDLNVFNVSFSELTLGKEVETFIEQCSDSELIEWDACGRLLFEMG